MSLCSRRGLDDRFTNREHGNETYLITDASVSSNMVVNAGAMPAKLFTRTRRTIIVSLQWEVFSASGDFKIQMSYVNARMYVLSIFCLYSSVLFKLEQDANRCSHLIRVIHIL